jgi:hypothetical protein
MTDKPQTPNSTIAHNQINGALDFRKSHDGLAGDKNVLVLIPIRDNKDQTFDRFLCRG